jgi:hypothetical protein
MTADLGPAGNFLVLNGVEIVCNDISKATIEAGMYLLKIFLDDKRDIVLYNFSIFVTDLPPEPVVIGKSEESEEITDKVTSQIISGSTTIQQLPITESMLPE